MAKSKTIFGPRAAAGCLLLFALPFAIAGVVTTIKSYRTLATHAELADWREVPATITAVALRGKRLTASYTYEVSGQRFTSHRVLYDEATQGLGGVDRLAYSELQQHANSGQPFRAFVDPGNPAEAVLYRHLPWQPLALFTVFGAAFGAVGVGMFAALLAGWRGDRGHVAAAAFDDEAVAAAPWLTRTDWAAGQIAPQSSWQVAPAVLGAAAVWWWLASWPLVSILPQHLGRGLNFWLSATLLIPLVGVVLVGLLWRAAARAWKYGDSSFELAGPTGVLGGQLAGVVRIPAPVEARQGFRVRLAALETVGGGDDKKTVVRWEDEQLVTRTLDDPTGRSTAVPILFAIPLAAPPASVPGDEQPLRWELEVTAATPGVDYRSRFDVPVFKTSASRADFALDRGLAAEYASPVEAARVLRAAGLKVEALAGGGTRLVVPMARNWRQALLASLAVAALGGFAWHMLQHGWWTVAPIFLGLLVLVFALVALELWLYRSTIDATRKGLTVRGGWLGIGPTRHVLPDDLAHIRARPQISSGRDVWYQIEVKRRGHKSVTLAKGIRGKLLERAIVATLSAAVGGETPRDRSQA